MYGDVDGIAALVDDFDHLLEGLSSSCVSDGHPYQPAELAHAVIDVHHVVAHLKLLNLLQRQRHLAAAGLVALQVVFVETVEDLVVGEEAEPEVVVDETLVQRLVDALKAEAALLCEDVLQSFYLLRAVGQHEELVAFQEVVLQSLRQQVEVLVEQGLR